MARNAEVTIETDDHGKVVARIESPTEDLEARMWEIGNAVGRGPGRPIDKGIRVDKVGGKTRMTIQIIYDDWR